MFVHLISLFMNVLVQQIFKCALCKRIRAEFKPKELSERLPSHETSLSITFSHNSLCKEINIESRNNRG
jgi:hypothetical protein